MIVDPDFFEHWRTRMLVDALGKDEFAPMYVMRIWAHCQSRRATRFDAMPAAGLKALCRFPGDAAALELALTEAGFICRDGNAIDVPKWAEHNAKLISNWANGLKGGRPKQTDEEPNENPNGTQPKPTETQGDPIGGEEIRSKPLSDKSDVPEILEYLNAKTGKGYRPVKSNLLLIASRLKEGATPADCRAVIDMKVDKWLNDPKMVEYLRPETLFGAKKFAQYVGELGKKTMKPWEMP